MFRRPNHLSAAKPAMTLVFVLLVASLVNAEQPNLTGSETDAELVSLVAGQATSVTKQCEFAIATPRREKLVAKENSILRWSNPTAGKVFGEVRIWTRDDRPIVAASIYRFFNPNWGSTLELVSLSDQTLAGSRGNIEFWRPGASPVKFRKLADADLPVSTPAGRLVQMRRLASRFTAQLEDHRTTEEKDGVRRELRLLPNPVYRFKNREVLDGAMFALVEGTDPEALLMLEARTTGGEADVHWEYAVARMNRDEIWISYQSEAVWEAPRLPDFLEKKSEPYTAFSLDRPPFLPPK